ncbi:SET domain-containing protein 5 [Podospora fimiseda]|uniref:SET domain-containing protein 5 n=1 Tax=Podospora fimiseda TaxID=252190 RepID=A0AAN7BWU4_9PEZI|nr:SET domain-containing protein 5 [Podospora fimiseda]
MYLLDPILLTSLSLIFGLVHSQDPIPNPEKCLQPLIPSNQQICPSLLPKRLPTPQNNQKPLQDDFNHPYDHSNLDDEFALDDEYHLPPPWHGPTSCISSYCLYSNPSLSISLFTTPKNAYLTSQFPLPSPKNRKVISPSSFYEAQIPGKGIGLIANRTIHKGEIIMQRIPTLLIQAIPHSTYSDRTKETLYKKALELLPEDTQQKFMRQYGNNITAKVDKNSFRMLTDHDPKAEGESEHFAVFPDVSRINHDCRPNLHYRLQNHTHTTVAVRDISPGEELTLSYIYGQSLYSTRQAHLQQIWGFPCTCSQCSLPSLLSQASDARIREIRNLEKEIEEKMARNNGIEIKPEMAGRLVKLYLDERLEAYMAPTYTRAALIYSMFGDEAKAMEYAKEAVEALEREHGEDNGDAESMKEMLRNLKGHWSWRIKVRPPLGSSGEAKEKKKGTVRRAPVANRTKSGI